MKQDTGRSHRPPVFLILTLGGGGQNTKHSEPGFRDLTLNAENPPKEGSRPRIRCGLPASDRILSRERSSAFFKRRPCKSAGPLKPPPNNLNFFLPQKERNLQCTGTSGPTSRPWTCGGIWAQPAWARADPPPTRPHRAREVAAVSGAPRSPLRGLLAGRIPTRPGHFPLLCRNAVRLKKDEGRR